MVVLDFEKNRVGLGEKINNYGAAIIDRLAPPPSDDKGDDKEDDND
jgi:hypothetical protein